MLIRRAADSELHCERVITDQKCLECGGFKRDNHNRRFLHRYSVETEGLEFLRLKFEDPHLFCDHWCRESYYRKQI